ncbi:hypothetical protein EOL73_03800 [Candidatus Saccharibacteria bacterium]|nr:hypothetical protein [Candidatus Saccharibacteria bacterium]
MITLHIAKWLEEQGFGTLDTDIFWEVAPLGSDGKPKNGIWVVSRGSSVSRLNTTIQAFDIYSRYTNKITGSQKLEAILERIKSAYGDTCELPTVPPHSLTQYTQVMLTPVSGVENVGTDEQDKVVRVISGEVRYTIN